MSPIEAHHTLRRTALRTIAGSRLVLLRVAIVALLTMDTLAKSDVGKELKKAADKTTGERLSITRELGAKVLEQLGEPGELPTDENNEVENEPAPAKTARTAKTPKGKKSGKDAAETPDAGETQANGEGGNADAGGPASDVL